MSKPLCSYFFLTTGKIPIPGHHQALRVPICRCVLTETLVARLRTHPDGEQLASFLEGTPLDGQHRPVMGADLEPVSRLDCDEERKQVRCLPQFLILLHEFGLDTTLPKQDTKQDTSQE